MASASSSHGDVARMRNAALVMYDENQSLIVDFRKALSVIKGIAVDLERDNQSGKVREPEGVVLKLLAKSEECGHFSSAIQSVSNNYQGCPPGEEVREPEGVVLKLLAKSEERGHFSSAIQSVSNNYQGCPPGEESTDFKKLLEDEVKKLKATSSTLPQNHVLYRQFKEAVWNVHHAGQPMPGEEQEDIVMTSTRSNILNMTCPLSGKPITERADPVRSVDCKHIYEKKAVQHYMKSKGAQPQCPVTGCPKILQQIGRVLCDPLLIVEIDELRAMGKQNAQPAMVEDFTLLDED